MSALVGIKDLWGFACEVFTPPPSSSCNLNLGGLYGLTGCLGKGPATCLPGQRGCGKAGTLYYIAVPQFPHV